MNRKACPLSVFNAHLLRPRLRPLNERPVVRTAISRSGLPELLNNAIEAILATVRLPKERDRRRIENPERADQRGMVDIALVLVLRG